MKKLFFILFICSLVSCEQKVSQSQPKSLDSSASLFYGNWLLREYFDSLKPNYQGSLSASQWGITELVFSPAFKDSVLFINEDLEISMEKIEIIADDTILLSLTDAPYNRIIYNERTKNLEYQIDERYPTYHFFKAPASLIELTPYPTAFRNKLNIFFADYEFVEIPNKGTVYLHSGGYTRGLNEYTSYKITVNGDLDNIKDASRIEFSDEKKTDSYGFKLTEKGFDLYTLKLLTQPGEKPFYKTDKLFKRFFKTR
jgi:hypothetical protein